MAPRRIPDPEWWTTMSSGTKAAVTILTVTTALVGLLSGWSARSAVQEQLPVRVSALETTVLGMAGDIRDIKQILLDMNCQQRKLTYAECLNERLRNGAH